MSSTPGKTIEEYKAVLTGKPKTFQCELLYLDADRAVVIYRLTKEVVVAGVKMPLGTISYGYFWESRNYNVYHFVDPAGQTLGLYFNVSDSTQITHRRIYWRDLIVDLLATPNGVCRVLDEEEIPNTIPDSLRRLIFATRDQILKQVNELVWEIEAQTAGFLAESLRQ